MKTDLSAYFAFIVTVFFMLAPASEQSIEFSIKDDTGAALPCRIHVHNSRGEPLRPSGHPSWNDHFVCDGTATIDAPPGTYSWTIQRGPEFQSESGTIEVADSRAAKIDQTLHRIAFLRKDGWYSGDLHVHRPVNDIPLLMRAEDLDFAPVIEWWNEQGSDLPALKDLDVRFDGHRIFQRYVGEDERGGGALLYFGLNNPLDLKGSDREFPSPVKFVEQARKRNADVWIDIEKPFWWDVPTWLASGKMNSIGIANNHMCRSQMLENEAWGKPRDATRLPNPTGNGYWTQEIYYHALNCGLRIPPSAGSASGVLPNPVGYNRVYVQLEDQPFNRENWFAALANGHCFVTNGPLLRAKVNELHPGAELALDTHEAADVHFDIALSSQDPVSEIQVIHNGEIVKRLACSSETNQQLAGSLKIDQPGWLLFRAIADVDHTFRFASTAPWYIKGANTTMPISRTSAQFFLDWTNQRIAQIEQKLKDASQRRSVLEPHQTAKKYWEEKLAAAGAPKTEGEDVAESSEGARRLPMATNVDAQPLLASINRLIEALDYVGSPLPDSIAKKLQDLDASDNLQTTRRVQQLLDPMCLAGVSVRQKGPPLIKIGQAKRELLEQGWRTFLVKVVNKPGLKRRLLVESPNAQPLPHSPADQVTSRWMQLSSFEGRPMKANLSGLELEYRIVQIYSRDAGPKNALLEFTISNKAGDDGALIREWRFGKGTDGWNEMNQVKIVPRDGSLHITSSGDDPFMGAEVESRGGPMLLRFWAKSDVDGIGQIFWWTKDRPQPTGDRQTNYIIEPGEERLYEVPFHVDGELAGVRIDPLVKPGKIRIDWIDLYSAQRTKNWARLPLDFQCNTATPVTFSIRDDEGLPAFAKFEIRDAKGRIYPAQSKRLAPDFFFQRHIYRGNGESISLPPGEYTVKCSRGPETIPETKRLLVQQEPKQLVYRVQRWIDPSKSGWWSGDHHIHAAGCLHYNNPTEGVKPDDMIRHIMGEDLKVGCCLTWGPCFDYQKRFFTGEVAQQSRYPYTLRYDVEVSGFGSHSSGHLNLLNLKEQIYPGGESKDHWPTLGLNTLRWAKRQGAVCGPAHSAIGLTAFVGRLPNSDGKDGPNSLPNFNIPAFDGIGANEFIVDVTHEVPGLDGKPVRAVDFISTMNTPRVAELNMWYHVLNCGFRVSASGETDFPCMSGDRVGIGRVYAKVDGKLTFEKWATSIGNGRSYVSDGYCHLLDYSAKTNGTSATMVGTNKSELKLKEPTEVTFEVDAAARIDNKQSVAAELVINGYPVAKQTITASGNTHKIKFSHKINRSSWVAIRVFPHAHTNPIYLVVDDQPIRGNIDSARWCLAGVKQCWRSKQNTYAADEQADAKAAYDHARKVYEDLIEHAKDAK